jgi:DDE superfamily endonuclease
MEIFFPAQTLSLLHIFAPCCTAPSLAYFQSYLWALMVVEGRKCLTRLARCAFFHQRDLSSWERFLAEHRWSLTAVTERLVTLVVAKLGERLQIHRASLVGTDTTLVAKTAKRMLGVQKWKDHSDKADRGGYLVGHHWNLVGLISPWGTRWLCWPLVMRLVPGLQGAGQWLVGAAVAPMSFWDAAIAALLEVTRCLGDVAVRVVADAYYSKAPFLNGLRARGIDVISRLRQEAGGLGRSCPPASWEAGPYAPLWAQVDVGPPVDGGDAGTGPPHLVRQVGHGGLCGPGRVAARRRPEGPGGRAGGGQGAHRLGQHGPGAVGAPEH